MFTFVFSSMALLLGNIIIENCVGLASSLSVPPTVCQNFTVLPNRGCTNEAIVHLLPPINRTATNLSDCCAQCIGHSPKCNAFTFHGSESTSGHCLLAEAASTPGVVHGAFCASTHPFPPTRPPSPRPTPQPLPQPPKDLAIPQLKQLSSPLTPIMHDKTGFIRDPSSPIQDPVTGRWHAWVVWVSGVECYCGCLF